MLEIYNKKKKHVHLKQNNIEGNEFRERSYYLIYHQVPIQFIVEIVKYLFYQHNYSCLCIKM